MNHIWLGFFAMVAISSNSIASEPESLCNAIIDFGNAIPDGTERKVTVSVSTLPAEGKSRNWGWSRNCEAHDFPQGTAICDLVSQKFSAEFLVSAAEAAVGCLSTSPFALPSGNLAILNFEIMVRTLSLSGVRDGTSIDVEFSRTSTTDSLTISGSRRSN